MSSDPLKSLTIGHLRGATTPFTLHFEKAKKLTVIYGENGTGKSTLCDGLELLGRGSISSLEGKGLGQTLPFWASIGKTPADISVCLTSANKSCSVRIFKRSVIVDPPADRPVVEVLRRSQLLRLIEAEPAKRYLEIQRFVDISQVEICENSLRATIRGLEGSREVAVARVGENERALIEFWTQAGHPSPSVFAWAAAESTRDQTQLEADLTALSKLLKAFTELRASVERAGNAEALMEPANKALADAQAELQNASAAITDGASDLVDILEATSRYLQHHAKPSVCPVCESADKVADLAARTTARMTQFAALSAAKNAVNKAERGLETASSGRESARAALVGKLDIYTQIISTPLPDKAAPPAAPLADKAGALDAWFVATTDYLSHLTRCQTELSDQKRFRSLLKAALEAYRTNAEEQERLDKLLPRLKQALVVCEDERRKFTDGILTAISNEVGRIYEKMHPGEGLSKITFQLDAAKRASLAIGSLCYGQDNAPPQAFFSESHLDTLGLCFFLALAKNGNSADTILVLDDVLASVDEPHVDRVIETLYEEAAHFRHCLITTHYRPWKEKLRWGWLKTGQCQFVELTKWSQSEGLRHTKSTPDIARLRLLLAEGEPDAQLVCAKAGVVLEAILDFLTRQYQCRVPRRPGGAYTLGDLLPALSSKLCNHLKLERLKEISDTGSPVFEERLLRPDIDELKRIAQVRNVFGCHFNDISFSLLGAEAIPFGQRVLEIAEWLIDEEAGWPAKERAGSYWSNSDDTRRLHPLKEPQ